MLNFNSNKFTPQRYRLRLIHPARRNQVSRVYDIIGWFYADLPATNNPAFSSYVTVPLFTAFPIDHCILRFRSLYGIRFPWKQRGP